MNIEALTMLDMAKKQIIPAVVKYKKELLETIVAQSEFGACDISVEKIIAKRIGELTRAMYDGILELEAAVDKSHGISSHYDLMLFIRDSIIPAMNKVRVAADELETIVGEEYWPFPTYDALLFNV